jgi:hypothetical protein
VSNHGYECAAYSLPVTCALRHPLPSLVCDSLTGSQLHAKLQEEVYTHRLFEDYSYHVHRVDSQLQTTRLFKFTANMTQHKNYSRLNAAKSRTALQEDIEAYSSMLRPTRFQNLQRRQRLLPRCRSTRTTIPFRCSHGRKTSGSC